MDRARQMQKEVIPPDSASRLFARASELDVAAREGLTVAELRRAAAEAGISDRAFEQALAEMNGQETLPASSERTKRRRSAWLGAAAACVAVLLAIGLVGITRTGGLPEAEHPTPVPGTPSAAAVSSRTQVVVRTVGGQAVTMGVRRDGSLFAALGVAPDADGRRIGRVALGGNGGTATTPAALEVSGEPGEVMFTVPSDGEELELTVPGTTMQARGHTVRLVRDQAGGPLRAEVVSPQAR